jgi:hypothetical protein
MRRGAAPAGEAVMRLASGVIPRVVRRRLLLVVERREDAVRAHPAGRATRAQACGRSHGLEHVDDLARVELAQHTRRQRERRLEDGVREDAVLPEVAAQLQPADALGKGGRARRAATRGDGGDVEGGVEIDVKVGAHRRRRPG